MSLSSFEYPIHPIANILKKLINIYDEDHSYCITKMYKCYYIKTNFSFYDYIFEFIIDDDYFMENGLIKSHTVLSPGSLYDFRVDDADPYYVNDPDDLIELC